MAKWPLPVKPADLVLGLVAFAVLVTLFFAVAFAFAPPPVEYKNLPFPPLKPQVHAGDVEPLLVTRCVAVPFSGDPISYPIDHVLVSDKDGYQYPLPRAFVTANQGCETIPESFLGPIPQNLPPGFYHMEGQSMVSGRFRSGIVPWASMSFEVIR